MEEKRSRVSIWDSTTEDSFVELWQQRPCLFDVSSSGYHDRVKKDRKWKEIAQELDLPVAEVITHAASLRTQYGKLLHPRSSGSGTKDLTPRQKWIIKHLVFLKRHVLPRQSYSTLELEDTQPAFSGESEDPVESPASVSSAQDSTSVSYSPSATVETHHRIGKGAQRRRNRENEELTIKREKIEILKQADKNEDPDNIFGKQVVAEMHLLVDPLEKMQVRRANMRILYEAQDRCIAKSHQMTSRSQRSTSPPVHHTLSQVAPSYHQQTFPHYSQTSAASTPQPSSYLGMLTENLDDNDF